MTIIWFGRWWWARHGPFTFHRHFTPFKIKGQRRWTPFVTIRWAGP